MNREMFDLHVGTQLATTLRKCNVIFFDNLSSHKSPRAAQAVGYGSDQAHHALMTGRL